MSRGRTVNRFLGSIGRQIEAPLDLKDSSLERSHAAAGPRELGSDNWCLNET